MRCEGAVSACLGMARGVVCLHWRHVGDALCGGGWWRADVEGCVVGVRGALGAGVLLWGFFLGCARRLVLAGVPLTPCR